MQCPTCGRGVDALVHGSCPECAARNRTLVRVPEVVDVVMCPHCGSVRTGAHWEASPADRDHVTRTVLGRETWIDPEVEDARVERTIRWQDVRNAVATTHLTASFHGVPVKAEVASQVRLRSDVCPECSRRFGGYFEAVLQVRGHDPALLDKEQGAIVDRIERGLARMQQEQRTGAYVNRAEPVRGGFDFYVGSVEVARLVAQGLIDETGGDYAESKTIVGRRGGQDLYRFTLLVRLPAYRAGDFIDYDGRLCKVLRRERKLLTLWDLRRGDRFQKEAKRARVLRVVGRKEDEVDAVVVSHVGSTLQVLDPVTLRTVDLTVDWDVGDRETVRVFRHDETLYVVPPEAAA